MSETALSILLAVLCITFSVGLIGFLIASYIYKRKHNIPTGDCAYCHKGTKKMLDEYHKCYCQNKINR